MDRTPRRLLADGGGSANASLMQRQADLAGCDVLASTSPDLAARGAAWLAGLGAGVWDSLETLERLPREQVTFHPALDDTSRRAAREGWRDAVARARSSR
jgi:glycerol kinase